MLDPKRLAALEPVLKRGNTERVQLAAAGEYPLIVACHQTMERKPISRMDS